MPFVVEKSYYTHWARRERDFVEREYRRFSHLEIHFVSDSLQNGFNIGRLTKTESQLDERRFRFFSKRGFRENKMVLAMSCDEFWWDLIPWVNKCKVRWCARPKKLLVRHNTPNGPRYGERDRRRSGFSSYDVYLSPKQSQLIDWDLSFEDSKTAVYFYMMHEEIFERKA